MTARSSRQPAAVPDAEWLRPADAARLFGVCEKTLSRWADKRWIGRSRVGGRLVHYRTEDIAALLAAHSTPRQVVQIVEPAPVPAADDAWKSDPFWSRGRP